MDDEADAADTEDEDREADVASDATPALRPD